MEQAVTGIAAILEGHGEMLARLLAAAEEKPPEQAEMHELIRALTSLLRQQQGTLQRIEAGKTIGALVDDSILSNYRCLDCSHTF